MANTSSKKIETPKKAEPAKVGTVEVPVTNVETPVVENKAIEAENTELKNRLSEMEARMDAFMKMFTMMNGTMASSGTPDRDIEVISLTDGSLLLSTHNGPNARKYDFKEQFKVIYIPEKDLKEIVNSMPQTIAEGYCYINDEKFVSDNRLSYIYQNILDNKKMTGILDEGASAFMSAYENAPDGQKKILVSMVENKKLQNQPIDANIVMELGKRIGKNLMGIEPLDLE